MKKLGNKIVKVTAVNPEALSLRVHFSNGQCYLLSLHHLFATPKGLAAEIMRGNLFDQCFVESGALAWPNGFELCPDAVLQWAETQGYPHKRKAA